MTNYQAMKEELNKNKETLEIASKKSNELDKTTNDIKDIINNIKKAPLSELWAGSIHKNCAVTEVEIKDGEMQILSENQVYYEDEVPDWAR